MRRFVSESAICESQSVGEGTQISAFACISQGAQLGADCSIGHGAVVADQVLVGDRASVGANATIYSGVEIGENAVVEGGAVVTSSVPANAIVLGNPAYIVGYVDAAKDDNELQRSARLSLSDSPIEHEVIESSVPGVNVHRFPVIRDLRGSLMAGEFESFLPFTPRRFFMVFDVPGSEVRGEHAHRECHQFLICVRGQVMVLADDGTCREQFTLDSKSVGIHLPPMTWGTQYGYSPDTLLLVFASDPYDPDDYIRKYSDFIAERKHAQQ